MLSTSICRTRRARPAPSAARTANSRSRDVARANIRLPTLAQAIRSTRTTAPNNIHSVARTAPTI